jgi:hypothetical protein
MSEVREEILEAIESHAQSFDSLETIRVVPACDLVSGTPDWSRGYIRVVARRPWMVRAQIPSSLGSFPVRIVAATMEEQAARLLALRRGNATPTMAAAEWRTGFFTSESEAPRNYSRLTYKGIQPSRLLPVCEPMKMIVHVSPDQGWPMLKAFLSPAREWSIAMFDFTARHIYDQLCAAVGVKDSTLSLCLGPNESGDEGSRPSGIHEEDIVGGLRDLLGRRFRFAWASVGVTRQFASAYHIKVSVKDRATLWLSSGNWQSSNQPAKDYSSAETELPLDTAREMSRCNREWHIVVENPALAEIFRDYIEKDRETSEQEGMEEAEEEAATPQEEPLYPEDDEFTMEFRVPFSPLLGEEEAPRIPNKVFPALILERGDRVPIQPILTPDNYSNLILDLIQRAQHRLWFQNQSLVVNQFPSRDYRALLDALRTKCWELEDARVILRDLIRVKTLDVLRLLDRDGFPMHKIRVMKTCHTKGILVDSRWTLMGSHNWTNEGTVYNRDASLLIDDPRVTMYLENVFEHDWDRLAVHIDVDPAIPSAILPLPGESIAGETVVLDPRLDRSETV